MLPELSAAGLGRAIREGRTTALAATEASLDAIAARDGSLRAFIAVERDDALDAARARDAEHAAGRSRGPLHGVPVAIKDIFERKGKPMTGGSVVCAERPGQRDATVVRRLEAAGAVLVGTLNLDEFAAGGTGDNLHYGRCRNPWDPARITGGSSSGTASAVAAGLVPMAIGSDTGGSIRLPAAYCGVTALKATQGRVSGAGVFARAPPFDCVGPAARSVEDCRLLYAAIAGPDPEDPATAGLPAVAQEQGAAVGTLRLGIAVAPFAAAADPRVLACIDAAIAVFGRLGVRRIDADLPDLELITRLHQVVVKSEGARLHRAAFARDAQRISLPAKSAIETGLFVPPSRCAQALAVRPALLASFAARAFAAADVLLLPLAGSVAPRFEDLGGTSAAAIVRVFGDSARPLRFVNYLGLPALALPCGFVDGMPVGLQLVGRPLREDTLFALGAALQGATDWHRAAPASPR